MGRKSAPQPLPLAKAGCYASSPWRVETVGAGAPTTAVAAAAPHIRHHTTGDAETSTSNIHVISPVESISPAISLRSQPSQTPTQSSSISPSPASHFAASKTPHSAHTGLRKPFHTNTHSKSSSLGAGANPSASTTSLDLQRQLGKVELDRPPQLQLQNQQQQPRDTGLPISNCSSPPPRSPYSNHDTTPGSPPQSLHHPPTDGAQRPPAKNGLFHFGKSPSKRSHQVHNPPSPYHESRDLAKSRGNDGPGTPTSGDFLYDHNYLQRPVPSLASRSELSLLSAGDHDAGPALSPGKKTKSKSFGLLSRSRPNKDALDDDSRTLPIRPPASPHREHTYGNSESRTASLAQDRSFRDIMSSSSRNRSADRVIARESSRDKERGALPSSFKENGSAFLSGLRNSGTKATSMIGRGLFGKNSRSGSTTEREREPVLDDEHYSLKVINLPLVEQTRKTRISKRLETSRDKTEFWMPAFPWRAIDYLNYKGCDVEGLYRVPGSGPQIKKWQRKFDEQYDVNLFEEEDLYDINIIGSMLKAWLRELPDELFPKEAQDRIARECYGATEVPQMLIDELANLSPFNYYLLFAITCHLSLLLAHSDKNKMDFRNLCICFQPCMKIDAFCFKFLVCDWRNCWKGCINEAKYIEEEYRLFDVVPPRGITESISPVKNDEQLGRQPSSSNSSKPSTHNIDHVEHVHRRHFSESNASIGSKISSVSTNVTTNSDRDPQIERAADLRPLSPIKPLSPIGF